MTNNIAYDLDGVLVPDCAHIPEIASYNEFLKLTTYMLPLFQPTGRYSIITARPARFRKITEQWLKHLAIQPAYLFHEAVRESPAQYKALVLNDHPTIRVYVESDPKIVEELRKLVTTGCEIIHYSDYVNKSFKQRASRNEKQLSKSLRPTRNTKAKRK